MQNDFETFGTRPLWHYLVGAACMIAGVILVALAIVAL